MKRLIICENNLTFSGLISCRVRLGEYLHHPEKFDKNQHTMEGVSVLNL